MKPKLSLRTLALSIIVVALVGCASTKSIGEWRDPAFSGKLDNILIIGVTSRSTRRRVFEDEFVEALAAMEVKAMPSYELVTSSLKLSRETITEAIRGKNLDAVLVTRLAGVKSKETYQYPNENDANMTYFSYYDKALEQDTPGYTAQYREFTLETNVYDAASGKLVWSMQSQAIESSQPRNVIEDQIGLTIGKLRAQGLIGG